MNYKVESRENNLWDLGNEGLKRSGTSKPQAECLWSKSVSVSKLTFAENLLLSTLNRQSGKGKACLSQHNNFL